MKNHIVSLHGSADCRSQYAGPCKGYLQYRSYRIASHSISCCTMSEERRKEVIANVGNTTDMSREYRTRAISDASSPEGEVLLERSCVQLLASYCVRWNHDTSKYIQRCFLLNERSRPTQHPQATLSTGGNGTICGYRRRRFVLNEKHLW